MSVASKGKARLSTTSTVEDVIVPKSLLSTARFTSTGDRVRWEESLPYNHRVSVDVTADGQKARSSSLHSRKKSSTDQSHIVFNRSGSLPIMQAPQKPAPSQPPKEHHSSPGYERAHRPSVTFITSMFDEGPTMPIMPIEEKPSNSFEEDVNSRSQAQGRDVRKSSIQAIYDRAKLRGVSKRRYWLRLLFEYGLYVFLVCFIYFILIGVPLWKGAVWWLYWIVSHKFVIHGGWAITVGLAFLYAFCPLLILFEPDPPETIATEKVDIERNTANAKSTALLIPCYKSAEIIGPTLIAALKIFPPESIFVIANGNSETPLDNTEDVCRPYGVNHLWVPVGSKIVAQFAGCYAAKGFENVLLIDDDCALPPNFPVVCDRLKGKIKCIGYTIKSVGPNSSKGTYCQQAQDLEYKMSGLQRAFFGKLGSATFPHGAISLWSTQFLKKTFDDHPGFSVSEDWFFGDSCRRLGGRVKMCSSVFVETETPSSVFFSGSGSRGGFGEMTIFQQRFKRWNFFFVMGMWFDMRYILMNWKLGWCR